MLQLVAEHPQLFLSEETRPRRDPRDLRDNRLDVLRADDFRPGEPPGAPPTLLVQHVYRLVRQEPTLICFADSSAAARIALSV